MITTPCIFVFANHAHSAFESHRDHRAERRPKGGSESGPSGLTFRSSSSEQGPLGRQRAPMAGRPRAEAFWTEEPHNRRVKGQPRWEDSGGFQEALAHRLQTAMTVGESSTGSRPGAPRSVPSPTPHGLMGPHGPHGAGALPPGPRSSSEHGTLAPGFPTALHPSASGP